MSALSELLGLGMKERTEVTSLSPISSTRSEGIIRVQPDEGSRLVFLTEPTGLAVEQYKLLRQRLTVRHPKGGIMMITSPGSGEGKTLSAVNLAWCLAEGGVPTALVELDLREPGLTKTLRYRFDRGVEEVLAGTRCLTDAMYQLGDRPLRVLGVKQPTSSPSQLFLDGALTSMLSRLRSEFPWVIVDAPPVLPIADVAELVEHVDGAILVVRARKTHKTKIAPTLEILGSKLWGVLLNESAVSGDPYYGYGYGPYGNRYGIRTRTPKMNLLGLK